MQAKFIKTDLYRYNKNTSIIKGFRFEGFRYTYYLRKASQFKPNSILGIFYRIVLKRLSYKFGFQIPAATSIGKGLYIGHFGSIIINYKAIIGDYCNLTHNITIGETFRGAKKGCPTIGNYVWIGTGAVIVGKINIGNNVLIAPNTYVNFDVPDNSIVMGSQCKIIPNIEATQGYINNILS